MEKGRGDGLYINTAGIGFLKYPGLGPEKLREGDRVLVKASRGMRFERIAEALKCL